MNQRYIVISENLHTGEMVERHRFITKSYAELFRQSWNYGSFIGWIKDTETGEFF